MLPSQSTLKFINELTPKSINKQDKDLNINKIIKNGILEYKYNVFIDDEIENRNVFLIKLKKKDKENNYINNDKNDKNNKNNEINFIKAIDEGLAFYYKKHGKNNYFEQNGKGKFSKYLNNYKQKEINNIMNIIKIMLIYKDKNNKYYKETYNIDFKSNININYYYDNKEIRKCILLCEYIKLLKEWINYEINIKGKYAQTIIISNKYSILFDKFNNFFIKEMQCINDINLEKELNVLNILMNVICDDN